MCALGNAGIRYNILFRRHWQTSPSLYCSRTFFFPGTFLPQSLVEEPGRKRNAGGLTLWSPHAGRLRWELVAWLLRDTREAAAFPPPARSLSPPLTYSPSRLLSPLTLVPLSLSASLPSHAFLPLSCPVTPRSIPPLCRSFSSFSTYNHSSPCYSTLLFPPVLLHN